MDDDVLVLPLDMLQYGLHKPAVDEVMERFKQVHTLTDLRYFVIILNFGTPYIFYVITLNRVQTSKRC